jgi:hypothetical protein
MQASYYSQARSANIKNAPMSSIQFLSAISFVDDIIKKGQPWYDPDFPPIADSLANLDDSSEK